MQCIIIIYFIFIYLIGYIYTVKAHMRWFNQSSKIILSRIQNKNLHKNSHTDFNTFNTFPLLKIKNKIILSWTVSMDRNTQMTFQMGRDFEYLCRRQMDVSNSISVKYISQIIETQAKDTNILLIFRCGPNLFYFLFNHETNNSETQSNAEHKNMEKAKWTTEKQVVWASSLFLAAFSSSCFYKQWSLCGESHLCS